MHFLPKHPGAHCRPKWLALSLAVLGSASLASTPARAQTQDLFVADGVNLIRYAGTGSGTFSTSGTIITDPNLSNPIGLAFDPYGNLFVTGFATGSKNIIEFAAGSTPGTFAPSKIVMGSLAGSYMVFDAQGDLFRSGGNFVIESMAGATPGTFGATKTITAPGLISLRGLAFDSRGDLFAADVFGNSITEFMVGPTPGTFGATKTITDPLLNLTEGLTFDAQDNLFATNRGNSSLLEFAAGATPGTFGAATVLNSFLPYPNSLAFDAQGDLFVSAAGFSNGKGSITKFFGGRSSLGAVVESGLVGPTSIAFGPSAPPAVPEASTTVSFGLLLALGLGGLAIAAKRKKTMGKASA